MTIVRDGDELRAERDGAVLYRLRYHRCNEVAYIGDLEGQGDAGALRALLRYVQRDARGTGALVAVDASSPQTRKLCLVYGRMAKLEYIVFKV